MPRWIQRFDNYKRAHSSLADAMELMSTRELSDLEKQGVIQAFEFTWELAWNLLKDYLLWQGETEITGARDAIREAFSRGLIEEGQVWMAMLQDRNRTSHTYNESTMKEILSSIQSQYADQLNKLKMRFETLSSEHG